MHNPSGSKHPRSEFLTLSWQEEALAEEHWWGHRQRPPVPLGLPPTFLHCGPVLVWEEVSLKPRQDTGGPPHVAATTATFSTNVFTVFFPCSCFMTDVCSFLQNWYRCFAGFQCPSNVFEAINHQCYDTVLSNLLYKEWKKSNFPDNFSRCGKLLTQWGKQWLFMEQVLSARSLLPVYECLCSL